MKEVSELTGVSVRALHHYDAIGLLRPTQVTAAGYRLYDDAALRRLQSILLFRELQFPLKEIGRILDSTDFDVNEALAQQIKLLELQRKHIEKLLVFAREMQQKGVFPMNFEAFDNHELEQYKAEAKARWGDTSAWQQSEKKTAKRTPAQEQECAARLMDIFTELGALRTLPPEALAVQEKVAALQQFITAHYYDCTKEILRGLGQMYSADERFRQNIDRAGGEGTADFASRAIAVYCAE